MNTTRNKLFAPLTLRGTELKNRIAVSPMCMYSAEDGFANAWHQVHVGSRAVGGAGLILMEATAVSPEGRISPEDLGIWKDEHIQGLKEIVDFASSQGSVVGIQLAHAGRKASSASPWKGGAPLPPEKGGWKTVAPSPISFFEGESLPHALEATEIQQVVEDFTSAAERALRAGYQVAEIHAAHGYLLHQFLSPLSNQREDDYGGSFENRTRLLREVTEAVRSIWPQDRPLFVRISATDWTEGGWTAEDSVALAKILKELGVDLIDCSSGGLVSYAKIPVEKGYQTGFAEKIKAEADILTGAVGLITEPREAEDILQQDKADLIFLAREFLRNPYFPLQAALELGEEVKWPPQYERGKPRDF